MSYGAKVKAGYIDTAAWGDTWSAVTALLPVVSENLSVNYERLRSQALIGQAAAHESEIGRIMVAGDIVLELDYNNGHALFEHALGAVSSGTYTPTNDIEDYFHFEVDKGTKRYRFYSCAVNQVAIEGDAASEDPIKVTLSVVAYNATRVDTAFPSLSFTSPNRCYFQHLSYLRIGDLTDALAAGDNVAIKNFNLTIANNLQIDGKDSSSQSYVLVPMRNGWRVVTLKFALARYLTIADTLAGLRDAGTRIQGQLHFADGAETIDVYLPQGKIAAGGDMSVGGPGVIEGEFESEWFINSANSNMASVTDQLSVVVA